MTPGPRPHRHLFRRRPAPVSRPTDQGFVLAVTDVALVRAALADAAAHRAAIIAACGQCWPGLACDVHIPDAQAIVNYRQFAALMGGQP